MAEITVDSARTTDSRPVRSSFFLWMSVAMAATIFGGFGISYFQPMVAGVAQPLAPVVHVHGFFFFCWMTLLVVQSALINRRHVALHRSLGSLGIAIAAAMLCFGAVITILSTARDLSVSNPDVYGLMYISLLALIGFALLFFLAIGNIRDPDTHKRLILLATATFVIGGLNRIFLALFGIDFSTHLTYLPKYLTVDLFIIALLVYDWRTLGKPHWATLTGAGVNVVPQLLHVPIVDSAAFVSLTHWLGSLAHYG